MRASKSILGIILLLAMLLTACSSPATNNTEKRVDVLCDVEKFANISSAELVGLLGEPDNVEITTTNGFAEFPCVYYEYNNAKELGEVSFILINDSVVKLVSYHSYAYNGGKKILESFNLTAGDSCAADKKDTYARYRCVTDTVDDLWITLIDKSSDTFESLQVTYDMFYFEEWYMTMDTADESNYQYWTQESVKSILKAPNTAKFPNILDWKFGKNPYYVGVQSYVDAQNSFGAQIRSEFYFLYVAGTNQLVYVIFDGEVIVDNGYVATKELVAKLIDSAKTDSALTIPQPIVPDVTESPTTSEEGNNETSTPIESERPNETEAPTGTENNGSNENTPTSNKGDKTETTTHTHAYGNWSSSDNAQHKRVCSTCNHAEYANHSWNDGQVTKEATCAAEGITTYNCEVCGGNKTETIAKNENHVWDNGKVTQAATCSAEGVTTYTCNVCANQKTESLAKSSHDFSQKVESSEYLKSNASFYSGTTYYYSCSCGEKGTETFSLNDRKEWISDDQLKQSYGYGSAWMGEYIWIGKTDYSTNTEYNYQIYGSPASSFESGVVYSGNCNGSTVRFKYESSSICFNFNDLAAAGII